MEENYACSVCLDDKLYKKCYGCSEDSFEDYEHNKFTYDFPMEPTMYSYYGRICNDKPTMGVIYSMLDVHIEKMVNKYAKQFIDELTETLKSFKSSLKNNIEKISKSNSRNCAEIRDVRKKLDEKDKVINKFIKEKESIPSEDKKEFIEIKESLTKRGFIKKPLKKGKK